MIFVGIDWAEAHHDVCVLDEQGRVLGKGRVPDSIEGIGRLHAIVGEHAEEPSDVVVGIEIDRGLLVGALLAAGYRLYAINPFAVSRYRDRHAVSRAKSDPGDAKVLADVVRTDRQRHRALAGDSDLAEAIKVLARAHQNLIWSRQRQVNQLRNTLREFYPGRFVPSAPPSSGRSRPAASSRWHRPPRGPARSSPRSAFVARWSPRAAAATWTGAHGRSCKRCRRRRCRRRRWSSRPAATSWDRSWW